MQHKELRLGVVLTGGVSLVVYIHGVSKELLKLVRASRAYHDRDRTDGQPPEAYEDSCTGREIDTERVYFDLLKALGRHLDIRIVLDVIAGASAGGVNGIVLARALAHDLDIDSHRAMWLQHADAIELLDEQTGRWSKFALRPVLGWLLSSRFKTTAPEAETREKLATFMRSRWFHPPFSGPRYSGWLLDAFDAMARHAPPGGSLLPEGHPLDLYVSVTDFHGHTNRLPLHNPAEIIERDHRHVLNFRYLNMMQGGLRSDFTAEHVPGLTFAARATSCFPGAFPPARISEIDDILAERNRDWIGREDFVRDKLATFTTDGRSISDVFLIDGSVVNNKPFDPAIKAVAGRPAYRAVTRRLLFIEPDPPELADAEAFGAPGFFRTILASMAEIPRNEPINDDLARVHEFNRHTRLIGQVIDQVQPQVDGYVETILPPPETELMPSAERIAAWRSDANEQAAERAGYAFQGYFRLKVLRVAERLGALAGALAADPAAAARPGGAPTGLAAALSTLGISGEDSVPGTPASPAEIDFLKTFDLDFRIRRLRFVIRRLNRLYGRVRTDPEIEAHVERLDELKATLYGLIESARRRRSPGFYGEETASELRSVFSAPAPSSADITAAIEGLGESMALVPLDAEIDEVFAVMVPNYTPARLRRELYSAYLAFSFYDVLTLPMAQLDGFEELEEILIDRISPADAVAIRTGGASATLRGTAMRRFAGFFNRAYRENDYLWGRLNAADRLVDILLGAVEETDLLHGIDAAAFKHRLFEAILDAEEPFLKADENLIADLRQEIAGVKATGAERT